MTQADMADERATRQAPGAENRERLALLYQGILTAIVRIQSGKQPIADAGAFRHQMENILVEIEREGRKDGYSSEDVVDANYVVVAFLDEAVRRSNDRSRDQWTSLHTKLFGQAVAGEAVFERLKGIRARRDSPELADLLEVYCLCFLLGYEGRYAIEGRSELDRLIGELQGHIERIRGRQDALSPEGGLKSNPIQPSRPAVVDQKLKWAAVGSAGLGCLCWFGLNWGLLTSYAHEVAQGLNVR